LGKEHDKTRAEAIKIIEQAIKNRNYDCENMRLCLCLNWKEEQERIVKLYEEMREDEVVSSLGPTEKKLFDIQTQKVIDKVNEPEKAIELTKQ
jgi:hypothetical protein